MRTTAGPPWEVTGSPDAEDGHELERKPRRDTRLDIVDPEGGSSTRKSRVTATSNAVGDDPIRILYLWNFNTGDMNLRADVKSWQHYGPVYLLQSPRFLPMATYFRLLVEDPNSYFITGPSDVDRLLGEVDEEPIGPGLRGGRLGRYPRIWVPCSDATWQYTVKRLCSHVDVVALDARGYTAERDGLSWEIRHAVRSVPRQRLVIIADITTDLARLELQARAAGQADERSEHPVRVFYRGWGEVWSRGLADEIVTSLRTPSR
jgi:hypothetical protein